MQVRARGVATAVCVHRRNFLPWFFDINMHAYTHACMQYKRQEGQYVGDGWGIVYVWCVYCRWRVYASAADIGGYRLLHLIGCCTQCVYLVWLV